MRDALVDEARGAAFVLMLVHHATFFRALATSKTVQDVGTFASACGDVSRCMFIVLAGVSLGMQRTSLRRRIARCAEIGAHALAVSLATYVLLPGMWVRFGILHFMALGLLLTAALMHVDVAIAAATCAALVLAPQTGIGWLDTALGTARPANTIDYFPLRKWLPCLWLGVLFGKMVPRETKETRGTPLSPLLRLIGRNTLVLYTAHYVAMCAVAS
jgi:uncharacterized membrane protein